MPGPAQKLMSSEDGIGSQEAGMDGEENTGEVTARSEDMTSTTVEVEMGELRGKAPKFEFKSFPVLVVTILGVGLGMLVMYERWMGTGVGERWIVSIALGCPACWIRAVFVGLQIEQGALTAFGEARTKHKSLMYQC